MTATEAPWRFLIDANVHRDVGAALADAGHDIVYVFEVFPPKASDDEIDQYARSQGRIVVSHDARFMRRIQQQMFQFEEPLSSGYGRIMLSGNEVEVADRVREVFPLLEMLMERALASEQRFLVTVADTWIRYADRPRAMTTESRTER